MHLSSKIVDSLTDIDPGAWNALAGGQPFLRHEFLHALHETGAACPRTGWTPRYLTLWAGTELRGAMPLYLKSHSYGEYIFDWAWAEAYHRHGHAYYPKLLCAVPFTPVTGSRLLAATPEVERALRERALAMLEATSASSLHCLYPTHAQAQAMQQDGMLLRESVQFHWRNEGYESFSAFLATMSHDKRKKINQERRKLREHSVTFKALVGSAIEEADWRFFFRCYQNTYRQHGSTPYLSLEFFKRLGRSLPEHVYLAVAHKDNQPIAASLCIFDQERMYGRYWGCTAYVPGMHFEACYYQPIEFCIERKLTAFEGGAQGEHKLARGLLPVRTYSAHRIAHPQFATAIADFLRREARGVRHYMSELNESAPFKLGNL